MTQRTRLFDEEVYEYIRRCSSREPDVLARLREATARLPESQMQIGPDQGQLMALLVKLIGAKRCIEVGTYTGYSALAVALALPADGKLVACDINAEWTAMGRRFWREAGVEAKIDLRLKPALETLDELLAQGEAGRFDFAFLDADKPRYGAYYEKLLLLIRPGGLIAVDNTLALAGAPIMHQNSESANAMRAFNDAVHHDERVDLALLSVGEGLTLLRKRPA
ncbi:MAG TPA: class I SAM-dependent methyltransferase [Gammaproteobacteria bacterium]|nr:class I SAM-dependent methyltransferase [Gammaproteobacteria bacterium]